MRKPRPEILTVTPAAAKQLASMLRGRSQPTAGVRVGVRQRGCSGNAYTLAFAQEKEPMDEEVVINGIHIFIDPKAILFLIGTEMDYVQEKLDSGFKFTNPNEKGRCGCGESFHV